MLSKLKTMSVRKKMLIQIGLTIGSMMIILALSFATVTKVKVGGETFRSIVLDKDLLADILPPPEYIIESYLVASQMIYDSSDKMIADHLAKMDQLKNDYDTRHEYWVKELVDPKMRDVLLIGSYEPAKSFYTIFDNEFVPAIKSGDKDLATVILLNKLQSAYEKHRAAIDELVTLSVASATEHEADANDMVSKGNILMVAVNIFLALLTLSFMWLMRSQIASTIDGLIGSFRTIADSAGTIKVSSQTVSANSEETATQANVVSAAAEQINQNVKMVSTNMDQMNSSIQEISKNTSDAARVASEAVSAAQVTNDTINKLGESSVEIGNVLKVITSIAEQTNLLALNATIEAARAGEAGKGFAVVANEVKELAKQTAKATEDIGHRIETIQGDTSEAVTAIGSITNIINQINDIQNTVASAVEEQSATASEIARNIDEAAKGTSDIAHNITGVAQAAQTTSQEAGVAQGNAVTLTDMAEALKATIAAL